jgi:uncharacterized Fe-S cluster-containing radical SAM superfamily protein
MPLSTDQGWPSPPRAFHVLVTPRGSICNLDCQYCFYLKKEKLYPGATFRMSDATLEEFTRQYIQAQHVPEVTFSWQGGEPTLMGLPFFQKAVAYQQKYRKPGMNVQNSFQTNGILLDPDWCTFFHENNFLVGLSIDGRSGCTTSTVAIKATSRSSRRSCAQQSCSISTRWSLTHAHLCQRSQCSIWAGSLPVLTR